MSQNFLPDEDPSGGLETKPFLAHLEDLRWTIIRCAAVLAVGMIACAFGTKYILEALYVPYIKTGHDTKSLFNFNPVDPFSIHMEISFFGGLILALPFLLYFIGQFLLPALTEREKRFLLPIFAVGACLFVAGVTICYTLVLRTTLQFFFAYSDYLGFGANWTAKALIDFEVQMLIGFGIAFELPLVIVVLNLFGIVSADQLASKRRHAAFIIFVATCCIIPSTDLFSLGMLAVPMYLLFEASILVARIMEKRHRATKLTP